MVQPPAKRFSRPIHVTCHYQRHFNPPSKYTTPWHLYKNHGIERSCNLFHFPANAGSLIMPFMTLPTELHLLIGANLSAWEARPLRVVNRYFLALFPPPTHAELLELEKTEYAKSKDLWACAACKKLRKIDAFPRQITPPRKIPPGETEQSSRFCFDCGTRPRNGTEEDWLKFEYGSRWRDWHGRKYGNWG